MLLFSEMIRLANFFVLAAALAFSSVRCAYSDKESFITGIEPSFGEIDTKNDVVVYGENFDIDFFRNVSCSGSNRPIEANDTYVGRLIDSDGETVPDLDGSEPLSVVISWMSSSTLLAKMPELEEGEYTLVVTDPFGTIMTSPETYLVFGDGHDSDADSDADDDTDTGSDAGLDAAASDTDTDVDSDPDSDSDSDSDTDSNSDTNSDSATDAGIDTDVDSDFDAGGNNGFLARRERPPLQQMYFSTAGSNTEPIRRPEPNRRWFC